MPYLFEVLERQCSANFAWPHAKRERHAMRQAVLAILEPALARLASLAGVGVQPESAQRSFDDFLALYPDRPLSENKGGSGFNDALWLYAIARLLAPALIVESGTWRGQSAWLLRQAAPEAEIHSFDVERPEGPFQETRGVHYHLCHWTERPICPSGQGLALLFFDDHVSHAQRLVEAVERGFRLALFDDNFPAEQLHATGAPPVPTLAMLCDPTAEAGRVIEWQRNGKIYRYHDVLERRAAARDLIEDLLVLPELAPITRHPPGSRMTMVRLRAKDDERGKHHGS
jgi:hypothetical protein